MQRRTFLQGLLALPLLGAAVKAVSKEAPVPIFQAKSPQLFDVSMVKSGGHPINPLPVTYVLWFPEHQCEQLGLTRMMIVRGMSDLPLYVKFAASRIIDLEKGRVIKDRTRPIAEITDADHRSAIMSAEVDVYLRPWLTPDGKPVELTYQMMVERGLVKPYTYKVTCVDKDGNETGA